MLFLNFLNNIISVGICGLLTENCLLFRHYEQCKELNDLTFIQNQACNNCICIFLIFKLLGFVALLHE